MKIVFASTVIICTPSAAQTMNPQKRITPPPPPSPKTDRLLAKRAISKFLKIIAKADEVSIKSLSGVYAIRNEDGTYSEEDPKGDRSVSVSNPQQIQKLFHILQTSPAFGGGVTGCMTDVAIFKCKGEILAGMEFCEGQELRFSILSPDIHLQNPGPFRAWFVENRIRISLPQ